MGVPSPNIEGQGEEDLLRRAKAGDPEALRTLFEPHAAELRRRVRARMPALLRGKVSQSDVIQEVYLTAFERLHAFDPRDSDGFRRWLLKIVGFKVREETRRWMRTGKRSARREEGRITSVAGGVRVPARGPTPSSAAGGAEERRILRSALGHLAEADRLILEMVHFQGLSYPEAGRRLGISPDAARMRHGRALAHLGEAARGRLAR